MYKGYSSKRKKINFKFYLIIVILCLVIMFLFQHYSGLISNIAIKEALGQADSNSKNISDASKNYDYTVPENQNGFKLVSMDNEDICEGDLILVNNNISHNFKAKQELVSIYDKKTASYNTKDKNVLIEKRVMKPLNTMLDAFYEKTRQKTINIVAGHRDMEKQQSLYDQSIAQNGMEHTSKFVAIPGRSEHHTGLALDFSIFYENSRASKEYSGRGEYAWINENCYKYGFVQRYKSEKKDITMIEDEPWHFRYVGIPHAVIMEENNFCLEEYIDFLKMYKYGKKHLVKIYDGQEYEIYFCEKGNVFVPEQGQYTISGNNVDGFIVTVLK